ncbi:MAG: dipicolinate synthase subunit DpsA [Ruminococcaceae bacterium]|nr:dipicolinate synthase subunit DpsA [Oscillospiraceae bacterium]
MNKNLLLVGGDERFITVANTLSDYGFNTFVTAFRKNKNFKNNIRFLNSIFEMENADYVILPLPATKDKLTVFAPFSDTEIYLDDIYSNIKDCTLLCGKVDESIENSVKKYSIDVIDYFADETLTILNCIPTAEGAINIAIENTASTIFGSNCLVLGFGRVGKILAKTLSSLGANTFVEARKNSDLAWIKAFGYEGIKLDELKNSINKFDIIFNTIPHKILNEDILSNLKKDCLIVDLASYPYGADINFCRDNKIKYIIASSLPGKVAPHFAGKLIANTINDIIYERQVY